MFEHVTKRYGAFAAVDDFSLEILDEEFMVLLGPSGCGKTTALRMVAGLETITPGTLRIGDQVVNDVEAKDRNISMVFQSYALYPHMTVAKNIESPLVAPQVRGRRRANRASCTSTSAQERVAEAAATLGLTDLLDRKPAALSGGQRQRVALARAHRQPARGLPDGRAALEPRRQARAPRPDSSSSTSTSGCATTFIYVTHDQVEAMTMADRIAIMTDGRLQQVGPPQAVYERPHNLFVARFIGSPPMNTVTGTMRGRRRRGVRRSSASVASRSLRSAREPWPTAPKWSSACDPSTSRSAAGPIEATVVAVEWLGHERHIVCELAGEKVTIREPSETATGAVEGAAVRLRADPNSPPVRPGHDGATELTAPVAPEAQEAEALASTLDERSPRGPRHVSRRAKDIADRGRVLLPSADHLRDLLLLSALPALLPRPAPAEPLRHRRAVRRLQPVHRCPERRRASSTGCASAPPTCSTPCRSVSCSARCSPSPPTDGCAASRSFQTIFASTVATSVAVASVVFLVLINPQVGYFRDVSFFSLSDPDTALRGVALSSVWQNLGLSFIIVLAGLQAVPDELYEAAALDGYGPIRNFFRVTVPLISPTLMFLVVVLVIFAFQAFAQVDILTGGGPAGSTETLVWKIFNSQQPINQGEGAVMAIGLFGITLIVTLGAVPAARAASALWQLRRRRPTGRRRSGTWC